MSFPKSGAYYTFRLDPVASLRDIEDEEVLKAAREMTPNVYVACTIGNTGVPHPPPAYEVASIALVQQGLPPDSPEEFLESRMCVPIRPNAQHPEGRRPVHCCDPLPWDGCYHVALHRTHVRIRTKNRSTNPPHSLSPSECVMLEAIFDDDDERREHLRDCAAQGTTPSLASLGEMALASMKFADRKVSDVPYWQIMSARAEQDRRAWDADYNGPPASAHPGNEAPNDAATDAELASDGISVSDAEEDALAVLTHRADLGDLSPVIVPLSYDLSTLSAPPSPTGFMEELDAIKKIRSDYEERVRRLKDEVQRRDDEYMADIRARRVAEPTVQSKWPLLGGFVPFSNKVKARLGAFDMFLCFYVD
ncbi:hypothetical protein EV122DRAFT_202063 [Schizophyllum commune]